MIYKYIRRLGVDTRIMENGKFNNHKVWNFKVNHINEITPFSIESQNIFQSSKLLEANDGYMENIYNKL
jgi:hypothetical protein